MMNLAKEFDNFKPGTPNIVTIEREGELLEKWEYFNLLFWRVVDWKGSALEFDGQRYQGHSEKTRIFYALQFQKTTHMCEVVDKIKELRRIYDYTYQSKVNNLTVLN
ncbi:hypothetical protein [Mariniphaga sediminis]|uniref:hypothetical protein n=1 Tax=Mariniphaga sediminis TaxID=1628158 RepID=UPI0035615239